MFGYFGGRRDAGCCVRGVGRNLRGAGHDLRGSGCEMLSLTLELQTCQLGLCFAHVVTIQNVVLTFWCVILREQSLLLFHEHNPKDNEGISKHFMFCWQQLFGLLHNITISLTFIRPNKTEIKIIAERKMVGISTRVRTFTLHYLVITTPTPNPLLPPLLRNELRNFVNYRKHILQTKREISCA